MRARSIRARLRFDFIILQDRLGGMPAAWGFVKGGIGMVSFLLCDVAREAGAVVAAECR